MTTHAHAHPINPRKWLTLFAMTGSLCMILLDTTVVGVALPAIQNDLAITPLQLQWVINAYVLVLASFVAVGGRAADAFGRVPVFLVGVILFALASVWCGLADSGAQLVAARVLQGLGAAIMQPASASLVVNSFAPGERGKAMAVYAGIPMLFLAAGPVIDAEQLNLCSPRAFLAKVDPIIIAGEDVNTFPLEGLELAAVERDLLLRALEHTRWNVTHAARLLGLSRDTMRYRIDKFSLAPPASPEAPRIGH